jgi:hypothetical protein
MPGERNDKAARNPESQPAPTHDEIACRAHEIWLARGGDSGHEFDDWLAAEAEIYEAKQMRTATSENGRKASRRSTEGRSVNP